MRRGLFKTLAVALAVVVLIVTLLAIVAQRDEVDSRVANMFGGEQNMAILQHPDRVEILRIGSIQTADDPFRQGPPSEYPIITGPRTLSASMIGALTHDLIQPDTYVWDAVKTCLPTPGIRIDYIRGDDRLQLLICLKCDIMQVFRNDVRVGEEDFDAIHSEMVRIAKAAFPDDPIIQKVPEDRHAGEYHGL